MLISDYIILFTINLFMSVTWTMVHGFQFLNIRIFHSPVTEKKRVAGSHHETVNNAACCSVTGALRGYSSFPVK